MRQRTLFIIFTLSALAACRGQPRQAADVQPPAGSAQPPCEKDLRRFVQTTFVHGVPYECARAFVAQDEAMANLLGDAAFAPHRDNIVTALGMIGSQRAVGVLTGLIENGAGPAQSPDASGHLSPAETRVRLNAALALGYAANAGSGDATKELIKIVDTAGLRDSVKWQLPSGDSPSPQLRARAIVGLGLSGKPDALEKLRALQISIGGERQGGASTPADLAVVLEAIKANQLIAAIGLREYYRRNTTN